MPLIDLIDETFVVCDTKILAARLHDEDLWGAWWPELRLSIFMDRGDQGIRWSMSGGLVGSSEIWLEPFADGVIVHYYLRANLPTAKTMRNQGHMEERLRGQHAQRWKTRLNALKDELEGGRGPGLPRVVHVSG